MVIVTRTWALTQTCANCGSELKAGLFDLWRTSTQSGFWFTCPTCDKACPVAMSAVPAGLQSKVPVKKDATPNPKVSNLAITRDAFRAALTFED